LPDSLASILVQQKHATAHGFKRTEATADVLASFHIRSYSVEQETGVEQDITCSGKVRVHTTVSYETARDYEK
jgi:hypothetical protein